jgi:elongation factor 1-gamma
MSLTIYGPLTNYRVLLCLAVAELSGIKVEHKVINIGDTKNPDFLKKNPLGQVPVLETPEGPIYQTNAIIRHLARLSKGLYGSNNVETSHIDQWLDFLNCDILPAIYIVSGSVIGWTPFDEASDKKAREDITKYLTILNKHLDGK